MLARYALLGSAFTLSIGGILLLGIVPLFLTVGTYVEAFLLLLCFAFYNKRPFRLLSHFLNVLLLATLFDPAHIKAYAEFGQGVWVTVLDILSFLAFGVFPTLYFISLVKK